ncbi:MAG: hypothetical protein JST00_16365 [Deltaproteobacteria bacterium]|nr:hypothetical protein [Deltaproteobacteria bacterium]
MANANEIETTPRPRPAEGDAPNGAERAPKKPAAPPPRQSLADQERADWEGMGQSRYAPKED